MAFKESQENSSNIEEIKNSGLKLDWERLSFFCCPVCREDLVLFDHLDMYKCACGFKINTHRVLQRNLSRGFYIGNFTDETPF